MPVSLLLPVRLVKIQHSLPESKGENKEMRFNDWWNEHLAIPLEPAGQKKFASYHIIENCGVCKYWADKFELPPGLPPEAIEDLKDTHRQCENEMSPVMVAPIDFGCVHFKKK